LNIILLGPPGAGKGTQAQFLVEDRKMVQLSTGDILRAAVKEGSDIGKMADDIMKAGKLFPDELMGQILGNHIDKLDSHQGVIFDGFPRTVNQAEILDILLTDRDRKLHHVIELAVDVEALVERVTGRFTCGNCGAGYHDTFKPTVVEGVCDKCGHGEFKRRPDDNAETVRKRMDEYRAKTAPILPIYDERQLVSRVDGMADMPTVRAAIAKILDSE